MSLVTGACDITMLQSINVGTKVMVAVTLTCLPGSSDTYLMAMAGLDNQVHLYVGALTGQVSYIALLWALIIVIWAVESDRDLSHLVSNLQIMQIVHLSFRVGYKMQKL
jgi:hypothetical protein